MAHPLKSGLHAKFPLLAIGLLCGVSGAGMVPAEVIGHRYSRGVVVFGQCLRQLGLGRRPRPGPAGRGSSDDKINGHWLPPHGRVLFRIELADGTNLKASDFKPLAAPRTEWIRSEPDSPIRSRREASQQVVARLAAANSHLEAEWRAILRQGSSYVRLELTLRAKGADVAIRKIVLFEQVVPGATTVGTVAGLSGHFRHLLPGAAMRHPMSENTVGPGQLVRCAFLRNAILKDGETLVQSAVIGVVPRGQLRRGFLAYVERERAHPYRPLPALQQLVRYRVENPQIHRKRMSGCAIAQFGRELVRQRGGAPGFLPL